MIVPVVVLGVANGEAIAAEAAKGETVANVECEANGDVAVEGAGVANGEVAGLEAGTELLVKENEENADGAEGLELVLALRTEINRTTVKVSKRKKFCKPIIK